MMLSANGDPLTVLDGDGRVAGLFTLELVERLLAEEAAGMPGPTAGRGRGRACLAGRSALMALATLTRASPRRGNR